MRHLLLLLALLALLPSAAVAQTWPALGEPPPVAQDGRADVAVLVAVEDYLFVPDVEGAQRNLAEWEIFLSDGLGVPTVTTLVNEQATREEVLAAAESAAKLAGAESTVWFVFVGHGAPAPTDGDGLLLGVDVQQTARSVDARGIRRTELLQRLQAGPQKRTVVLLDACFSGQLPGGEPIVPGLQPLVPVAEKPGLAERTVLLTAAGSSEVAGPLPGLGRPAFSYLVLGGLRGWADGGRDGAVTADEAVSFAKRELLVVSGRRQTPTVSGLTDTVLAEGVRERKPLVQSEPKEPAAITTVAAPGARQPIDLRGRSRLFGSVGIGAGAETTYETGAFLFHAAAAIRLSKPEAATRIGLISSIGYANVRSVVAELVEANARQVFTSLGAPNATPEISATTHLGSFTVGPVLEVGQGAIRFFGDFRGGVALPIGGECVRWEIENNVNDPICASRDAKVSPIFSARLGVGYRLFEIAGHAGFTERRYELPWTDADGNPTTEELSNSLFVAGLTAGIGFDL